MIILRFLTFQLRTHLYSYLWLAIAILFIFPKIAALIFKYLLTNLIDSINRLSVFKSFFSSSIYLVHLNAHTSFELHNCSRTEYFYLTRQEFYNILSIQFWPCFSQIDHKWRYLKQKVNVDSKFQTLTIPCIYLWNTIQHTICQFKYDLSPTVYPNSVQK